MIGGKMLIRGRMTMHPLEKGSAADLPPGISEHLDVQLEPGWHFDRRKRTLVSDAGKSIKLRALLPSDVKIVPMAPSLADVDPMALSEEERLLARYLQVVLPSGADLVVLADALRELDGVAGVSAPPRIGLP